MLEIMRGPVVAPLLFGVACYPAQSFVLRTCSIPHVHAPAARLNRRGGCVRARPGSGVGAWEEVFLRTRHRHFLCMCRRTSRSPSATPPPIAADAAAAADAASPSAEGTEAVVAPQLFEFSEAVSRFRNADEGSEIWLVGCYHRGKPSVELVEEVIGTVKPRVVMVELDAHRIGLLPKGEAHEGDDGLCWWTPDQLTRGLKKPQTGKRQPGTRGERGEPGVEFHTAAIAAQACGARVLLGDRDLEDILRRQAEARSADEKQAAKPSGKRRRAGLDMEKLEGLIARGSALGQETPVTRDIMRKWSAAMQRIRPLEHAVSVTERDEVMAGNLMKVEGNITTVAVVGFGHLDGIENRLEAEGWKPARS